MIQSLWYLYICMHTDIRFVVIPSPESTFHSQVFQHGERFEDPGRQRAQLGGGHFQALEEWRVREQTLGQRLYAAEVHRPLGPSQKT